MDRILFLSWMLLASQTVAFLLFFVLLVRSQRDKEQSKITEEIKEPQISELEIQVNSLQDELEKTKTSYTAAQNELRELKKINSDLNEELRRLKDSQQANDAERGQLKKENLDLKTKLASKKQELEKIITQNLTAENELKKKNETNQILEKENKEIAAKLRDLEIRIVNLNKEKEMHPGVIAEDKIEDKEKTLISKEEPVKTQKPQEVRRGEQKKQKIGEILLAHDFISKDILDKALQHQEKYGGNLSQYLLAYGYIDESKLAQCLCTQFGIPYLPLMAYRIPDDIIKLVPVDIAEKYWLVPVDKIGNSVTVVMTDPLDSKAIKEIEEITGCTVRPFVGILSEIVDALETYYKIVIKAKGLKSAVPFFIDSKTYKGPERRQSIRYNVRIDVHFSIQGLYKKSVTKNVSREGLSLESDSPLPIGLLITLQIDLPREVSPLPIAAIVQVARVFPLENNKFDIGVKIMKISKQELDTILQYAVAYK